MKKKTLINELISFFEEKGYTVEEIDPMSGEIFLIVDGDEFTVNVYE
ncbi:hypothetical protein U732_15 [Clostridium argentinense CDC 2741]|uniref:Uncharacterized protein n=1 Tax=Clostridium argentinense CDC 2741 TaxID=1418104 RepID=A0A0C1QVR5_9CLOT|nr:hypothetical protein [Clostridium argentinense]KIE45062.1 hypothetical protein U732_15 [Clostridium argentinense CDC 2741]